MQTQPSVRCRRGIAFPVAVLLSAAIATRPLAAQSGQATSEAPGTGISVDARFGLTRLSGEWSGLAGGSLGISLTPRLRVGGAVATALRTARGGRLPSGGEGDIRLAHGGPFVEFDLLKGDYPFIGRLLVGGGHATLTDPSTGTRLDADSFVVFEPSVQLGTKLARGISVSANASYRTVSGSGGLAGVGASDLRGPAVSLALTWRYARE